VAKIRIHDTNICRDIFIGRNSRRPATGAQTAFWNFLTAEDPLADTQLVKPAQT
jgi:hypothetical protein